MSEATQIRRIISEFEKKLTNILPPQCEPITPALFMQRTGMTKQQYTAFIRTAPPDIKLQKHGVKGSGIMICWIAYCRYNEALKVTA